MKKSILWLIVLLCFLIVPVASYSAPVPTKPGALVSVDPLAAKKISAKLTTYPFYLTCDPYPASGIKPTEFDVLLDGSTTAIISPAKVNSDGTVVLMWEVDTLVAGNHTIQITAVNVQGTIRTPSTSVNFSWSQPVVPNITTQPANQTVLLGQAATFIVVNTGSPNPTYQWQRSNDGGVTFANIVGATAASYTTAPTLATDNGARFQVLITNIAALVTSNIAMLTVTVSAPAAPTNIRLSN